MGKKIRKHIKHIKIIDTSFFKHKTKEKLHTQNGNVPLNIVLMDRISFSVLRNEENRIRKIENISYEININDKWEWVVRYDDHGGTGLLHRHFRTNLTDNRIIESDAGIKKYKNKDFQLTWVCNDIRRNYLIFRKKFLTNCNLDKELWS